MAALVSAFGACAACCLLPFVFVSVGLAGTWITTLDVLEPYKWAFVAVTTLLLGYGFYAVYWKCAKAICASGAACKNCRTSRHAAASLWIGAVLLLGGVAFVYIEPLLMNE